MRIVMNQLIYVAHICIVVKLPDHNAFFKNQLTITSNNSYIDKCRCSLMCWKQLFALEQSSCLCGCVVFAFLHINEEVPCVFQLTSRFHATSRTSCRCFLRGWRLPKVLFNVRTLDRTVSACRTVRCFWRTVSSTIKSGISLPCWWSLENSKRPAFCRKSDASSTSNKIKQKREKNYFF